MVQRLSEHNRVHQGMAAHIGFVMPAQFRSAEVERGDLPAAVLDPDALKIASHAQIKGPFEDVRGLNAGLGQYNHLLSCAGFFIGRWFFE